MKLQCMINRESELYTKPAIIIIILRAYIHALLSTKLIKFATNPTMKTFPFRLLRLRMTEASPALGRAELPLVPKSH